MTLDIKPFVKLLKQKDARKARDWLEQNKGGVEGGDLGKGYLLAMQGMVSALESGGDLSLMKRILNGGNRKEVVEKFMRDSKTRLSLKFRPMDEQGFENAWVDVMNELSGETG